MSTLTLQQALNQLSAQPGQYNSVQALYDLASQVNVNATGEVTILYSGQTTKFDTAGNPLLTPQQLFKAMELNGESIRIIDNTDAAKFLDSSEFKEALGAQYGLSRTDISETRFEDLPPAKQAAMKEMKDSLFHKTDGPWAEASGRFVSDTVGVESKGSETHGTTLSHFLP